MNPALRNLRQPVRTRRFPLVQLASVLATVLGAVLTSPAASARPHPAPPAFPGPLNTVRLPPGPYAVRVMHDVMVAMPDGMRLATDVYRPRRPGTWAAILIRTPYGKHSDAAEGRFFASHGYAYVVQDVRGVFASEGTFNPYVNDPPDGLETAKWITRQPWFNARLGLALYGGSYMAATAIDTALGHPPDLKAVYIYIASANYHNDGAWRDGAERLQHNVGYGNMLCAEVVPRVLRPGSPLSTENPLIGLRPAQIWAEDRQTPLGSARISGTCPWYTHWVRNDDQDWYWDQAGFDHLPLLSRWPHVPTEILGAYYGLFLGGTVVDYNAIRKALRHHPRAPVALTLGPWTHGGNESEMAGSGYFGSGAIVNQDLQALAWFDRYVKAGNSGPAGQALVHYFIMGGGTGAITPYSGPPNPGEGDGRIDIRGTWRSASSYPPPGTKTLPLFVGPHNTLSSVAPRASSDPGRYVYRYNPVHPVPTMGGNFTFGQGVAANGAQNQTCTPLLLDCGGSAQALDRRSDVIALETPVLTKAVTIAGHVTAALYVSSSAPDTDFTARLLDDYPNGTHINVASGIIDAKYRNGLSTPQRMSAGRIYRLTIDLWETGQVFEPGHRIELDVSSSNFPDFNRNMNVFANEGLQTTREAVTAVETLYFGAGTPSQVDLPVSRGSQVGFTTIGH